MYVRVHLNTEKFIQKQTHCTVLDNSEGFSQNNRRIVHIVYIEGPGTYITLSFARTCFFGKTFSDDILLAVLFSLNIIFILCARRFIALSSQLSVEAVTLGGQCVPIIDRDSIVNECRVFFVSE